MKKHVYLFLLAFPLFSWSQNNDSILNNCLFTESVEVHKPVFAQVEDIKGKTFEAADLIKNSYVAKENWRPEEGDELEWPSFQFLKWSKQKAQKAKFSLGKVKQDYELRYAAFYLSNDEWANLEIELTSGQMLEVFVDGKLEKGKYTFEKEGEEKKLVLNTKLEANNHVFLVKLLASAEENDSWSFSVSYKTMNKKNTYDLKTSLNPKFYMDIAHLMHGVDIIDAEISPLGDYYFVSYQMQFSEEEKLKITDVKRLTNNETVAVFYDSEISSLNWIPKSNKLSYITQVGDNKWIWSHQLEDGQKYPIATDLANVSSYVWSSDASYLILTKYDKGEKSKNGLKQVQGMPDHWPWYRMRSQLYYYDVLSGVEFPLTHGFLSNQLQSISPNSRYILFSQSSYNESQRPYSKQVMMQYDRRSGQLDTLWNKFGSGSAAYSPDGKSLLVTAGPTFFGDVGVNLTTSDIPNDYDIQAYIYYLSDGRVEPISNTFNPSIQDFYWDENQTDFIYFKVADRTYQYIYRYSVSTSSFELLPLGLDVIDQMSISDNKGLLLYYGSSISTPKQLKILQFNDLSAQLLDYPEESFFEDVEFGKTEEWNFKNREGVTIEGRLYYPPQFDASKKYPMIVYYYGGTSPTERNFRGRYPKNLFAANGYIVYVLQPSGAIGYGQDFSAQHVNNWGKTVAGEIIQGSKELCRTFDYIDSSKVGCIGASYGGFMTMYLTTQTDFFSAAISHAGISSISSYWGEGYWGYLYSQVASAESFPWNNKELYVEQSPLFHADKVTTPILLLHGNSDTNVPPGESRQFYTALKLLKKEVELIEIDQQDHHIKDYKKRILWQKTILAWFDKNLKSQSDWWFDLYPPQKM